MDRKLSAFVDFVADALLDEEPLRDNFDQDYREVTALFGDVKDTMFGLEALAELRTRRSIDLDLLMILACGSSRRNELLMNMLYQPEILGCTRHEVLDAALSIPRQLWGQEEAFDAVAFGRLIRPDDDLSVIFERKDLFRGESTLPFPIPHELYWTHKVQWYIGKKDFRRAWDELRKARKGFTKAPDDPAEAMLEQHRISTSLRRGNPFFGGNYSVDSTVTKPLINQLYSAMVQARIVKLEELPALKKHTGLRTTMKTYVIREDRKHYTADQNVPLAGLDVANDFIEERTRNGFVFSETGAMALAIANHFRTVRNEAKRKKYLSVIKTLKK